MARFTTKRKDGKDKDKDKKGKPPAVQRRKFCRFTAEGIKTVDYKDVDLLKDFINENGRIIPARITGTKSRYQRQLGIAIERALSCVASLHRFALRSGKHADHSDGERWSTSVNWATLSK